MQRGVYKFLITIFFASGLFSLVQIKAENSFNDDLEKTIILVAKAYNEKDATNLNKLIHKDYNLVVLFRRGVFDEYSKTHKIDFDIPTPKYLPYLCVKTDYQISFEITPSFDCNTMEWSKTGFFCDSLHTDKILSTIALNLKQNRDDKISESEIKEFESLEKKSRRVVLSDKNGNDFVFYLTHIKGKWYLTILDRLTSDCSA